MTDDVPSQARFVGWLALVLMAVTVIAAAMVLAAASISPPAL